MTSRVAELRESLGAIAGRPYSQAQALAGDYYTRNDWLEVEQRELFGNQWVCVGRVEEIDKPGDFMACRVGGEPVLLAHGEDGVIRALSNVCRHRGTTLMEGSGNSKSFICPYHHWTYDNTGDLIAAPSIKASDVFDPASCRLPEFRCTQWRGFLFVTLSELTPDLHTGLQALDAEIGNYHLEEMQLKYVAQDLWSVNWKSLMENYMEGYHLTPLHRETLHKVNPTRLCQHMAPGESHFGYRVGFTTRVPQDTIGHPDLSADERNSCVMAAIPPGLGIGIGSDYSSFICLTPESPESVNVKTGLLFFGDNWPDQDVEQAVALFQHTMKEDEDVLVRVRDGLRSNAYQPGPLAPQDLEGTVWDFYQYLSRHLATLPN